MKTSEKIRKRITDAREKTENENERINKARLDFLVEKDDDPQADLSGRSFIDINQVCGEQSAAARFYSTDNISEFIEEGEMDLLVEEVQENMQAVLDSLVIDTDNDHNTRDTAKRVAKMMLFETFSGRYTPMPEATAFPNVTQYDQIYIAGPIDIKSTCAHHFQNIVGKCWIGIKPGKDVVGLSKFNRVAEWLARRPSIQEELTEQIADYVQEITQAEGVAVFLRAEHMCMTHRGVRAHCSDMKTSVVRGVFRTDQSMKDEWFKILAL